MEQIKNRIQYIDAMRGFTMILVVYHHVLLKSILSDSFSLNDIFIVFRMPLFFFVSGFVLYKTTKIWDVRSSLDFLKKKFQIQVVSTLFFLLFADVIFRINIINSLFSFAKNGYWFTITLFEYFVLFVLIEYLIYKLKLKKYETCVLFLYAIIVVSIPFISYVLPTLGWEDNRLYNLFGIRQFYYYIFFAFGLFVKKYFYIFEKYVFTDKFFFIIFFIFNSVFIYNYLYNTCLLFSIFARLIEGFLGILIIFSIFKKYSFCFENNTIVGRTLQYIGRRTLDVYLLHYFFIPKFQLDCISDPMIEFIVIMFFSTVTIFFSLIISSIIRVSPSLAQFLFGVKK